MSWQKVGFLNIRLMATVLDNHGLNPFVRMFKKRTYWSDKSDPGPGWGVSNPFHVPWHAMLYGCIADPTDEGARGVLSYELFFDIPERNQ